MSARNSRSLAPASSNKSRRRRTRLVSRRLAHLGRGDSLAHESLEQRLALAVNVYANDPWLTPGANGGAAVTNAGAVTIVSDSGSDIYIQQVATVPEALLVADNPSFQNAHVVNDIQSYQTIYMTNGAGQAATVGQSSDFYPAQGLVGQGITSYVLQAPSFVNPGRLEDVNGYAAEITYAGQRWRFDENGLLVSGPGSGSQPATPIRPLSLAFVNANGDSQRFTRTDQIVEVVWSAPPVVDAASGVPVVTYINYRSWRPGLYGPYLENDSVADFDLVPSSGSVPSFTLSSPDAPRQGLVSGSLSGAVLVKGPQGTGQTEIPFRTSALTGNSLLFSYGGTTGLTADFLINGDVRQMSGTVDWATGKVSLKFVALGDAGFGSGPTVLGPQDVGLVELNAAFGLAGNDGVPMTATVFPGLDIDRELVVNLLSPGSTLNIDSPVLTGSTTASAIAVLGSDVLTAGTVTSIELVGGGGVYTVAPTITLSAPPLGGTPATATCTIDSTGAVNTVTVSSPGSGYTTPPTVTFTAPQAAGSSAVVALNSSNINVNAVVVAATRFDVGPAGIDRYFAGRPVSAPPAISLQAYANALVLARGGGIDDIVIPPGAGGSGYDPGHPPRVWITGGGGFNAQGSAIVSPAGSIIGVTIDNPGTGYTSVPTVTIDPPAASATLAPSGVTALVAPDGTISSISVGSSGYGYRGAPVVTIAPPPAGSGGTRAVAHAVLDSSGAVTSIVVDYAGSGYDPNNRPLVIVADPLANGVAELVSINASVGAKVYDIRLADDTATAVDRGQLYVSGTGSLSGNASPTAATVSTPARAIFVQAVTSDVVLDGTVYGNKQTYLLQSTAERSYLAPFLFTTTSPVTGASTGLVRGGVLAVTMANSANTPQNDSTAFNVVNLNTRVDTVRIRAARELVNPTGAYPYVLSLSEYDDVRFDAVAASSMPISISAAGNITFSSALATEGDLAITALSKSAAAPSTFRISAPMSTTFGAIYIEAGNVAVLNSLSVTGSKIDDARDDITIVASGGSISLGGLVSAVNNIKLVQRNSGVTLGSVAGAARMFCNSVEIESEGSVNVNTQAVSLSAVAVSGFTLNEADNITIKSLRSAGLVSLTASGSDPVPGSENAVALKASMTDVRNLVLSAPRGSIDVFADTSDTIVLGDVAGLAGGYAKAMQAAGFSRIRSYGSIDVLDAPVAGSSAFQVRVATTRALTATYAPGSPGSTPGTLRGLGNINATNAFDGITDLRLGDRVLVKNGIAGVGAQANGVYTVTTVGGGVGANASWQLTRSLDADTSAECPTGSYVRVKAGTVSRGAIFSLQYTALPTTVALRSSATELELSEQYRAGFASKLSPGQLVVGAGIAPGATIAAVNVATGVVTLTANAITGVGPTSVQFLNRPFGQTEITATPASLKTNIGSDAVDSRVTLVVSTASGTNSAGGGLGKMIALRNSLDTSDSLYNPDQIMDVKFSGNLVSPIRLTEELPQITRGFVLDGGARYGVSSTGQTRLTIDGSRITRTNLGALVTAGTEVNGLNLESTVSGMQVKNMSVGGFMQGAAVKVNGAQEVIIDKMTLGQDQAGRRLGNKFGLLVTGASEEVTLSNSLVTSSDTAGVRVEGTASRVALVGDTVGLIGQENTTGVDLSSSSGVRLGVQAITPLLPVAATGTRVDGTRFTIPAASASGLVVGWGVTGAGITASGNTPATIAAISTNAVTQVTTITISGGTVAATGPVQFGHYAATTEGGRSLLIPSSVPLQLVYVGQTISGLGIAAGSTIVAIDRTTREVTLSADMTDSLLSAISFSAGGRNLVQANRFGVSLANGSHMIANTMVIGSTFDGVTVRSGLQYIGTSTTRSKESNEIYGNRGYGIVVTGVTTPLIRGNFLGVQATGLVSKPNLKGNIYVVPANVAWAPNPTTAEDAAGNLHGKPKTTGTSLGGGGVANPITPSLPFPR
jgi:hypothetical protein